MTYTVKVQTSKGIKVTFEHDKLGTCIRHLWGESAPAVVVNGKGRIVSTNVKRTF